MKPYVNTEMSNLEAEYIKMKEVLYKKLFWTIAIVILMIILLHTVRAFVYARFGTFVLLSSLAILGSIFSYFVLKLKKSQELSMTILLILIYIGILLPHRISNVGYLGENAYDTFAFAACVTILERIKLSRISKFSHRTLYIVSVTLFRVFVFFPKEKGLFFFQLMYLGLTIYLDVDRERYDKNFFLSFFKNKEQLIKFKNLVVQDIPDSIVIITQDLMKPLFFNNAFEFLVESHSLSNIRTQLSRFILQETLENPNENNDPILDDLGDNTRSRARESSPPNETLLHFLETTIHQGEYFPNQKFSCNVTLEKARSDSDTSKSQSQDNYIFEAKAVHLQWDDQPAIAIILHDITQQHTILSLKIADANKDTILATVSHELRTPLNGILGIVQILEKHIENSELRRYLDICKNSANLLLSLVNSILDINQIRANKFKLCLEKVEVIKLLENIVNLFQFQCAQKGLYLKMKLSHTLPKFLNTDHNRLSQIFINLIGNAIKFTREGGITICAQESVDKDFITFRIEDTGFGIRDEEKDKLFKLFGKLEQKDNSVNPHGVGLGLTISDKLVRLLCGSLRAKGIQLESQFGKGSVFSFTIRKNMKKLEEDKNIDYMEAGIETPRKFFDEKGDVHKKMKNYTSPFVKTFSSFRSAMLPSQLRSSIGVQDIRQTSILLNDMPRIQNISNSLPNPGIQSIDYSFSSPCSNRGLSLSQVIPYILVIDDNPFNTLIAQQLISAHGYKVKTAFYSQVAIDILLNCDYTTEPIKLILMDCQMPVMDGYTTTRILRKMMVEKKIPEIPIVALTANDSELDREASKKAGMCEHIAKPLKECELAKILTKYISQ